MTPWQASVLEGRLVRLEPLRPDHADGLWEASRDPRTWRWLTVLQPTDRAGLDAIVSAALAAAADGSEVPFATVSRATGRVVGSTRFLALEPAHRTVEIGWTWLHPDAWGTGANAEAKLLQLRHAFEAWGCRRVEFKTEATNDRSRAALAAIGATFEGVHRKHRIVRDGERRDSAWYSVLDDEWPEVGPRLEARVAGLAPARE